jgi:hypothetical protein
LEPAAVFLAVLGALSAGLAYQLVSVIPAQARRRMLGAVRAFGRAIELRFPNHAGLNDLVARLARRSGHRLGLGPRRLADLEMSVRLRDIGLCAIPYGLVNGRTWGEWTLSETSTYDCHAEIGGAMLESVQTLARFAPVVRCHHTNFAVIEEAQLGPGARFDACLVKACAEYVWHARHRGAESARRHLRDGAGTLYEPRIAAQVLRAAEGWTAVK